MATIGKLKPLRHYSEFDVIPWVSYLHETGAKGTLVSFTASGIKTDDMGPAIVTNLAGQIGVTNNAYSPQYHVKAKVGPTPSGQMPLGMMLYDVLKQDALGIHQYRYDKQRAAEREAVVSGEAVPVVQKGYFLIGAFPTGTLISGGSFLAASDDGNGHFKVVSSNGTTAPTGGGTVAVTTCGRFLGPKDADGYALVYLNCHNGGY